MNNHTHLPTAGALRRRVFTAALLALALAAGLPAARAADANPPNVLTYQGYLEDGSGAPLAPATPNNYTVVFRIYNQESSGTVIWAEKQTVTVLNGRFSVLLGQGAATGEGGDTRPPLNTVFASGTASDRYLQLTVTVGGSPLTIAPRLRLVTSPYAFHARTATALVSPDGANLVTTANSALTVNGTMAATSFSGSGASLSNLDPSKITGTLAATQIPSLNANKINDGVLGADRIPSLNASKINVGVLGADRIPSLDGTKITGNLAASKITGTLPVANGGTGSSSQNFVDLSTSQSIAGTKNFTGKVGIGTTTPSAPLSVTTGGDFSSVNIQGVHMGILAAPYATSTGIEIVAAAGGLLTSTSKWARARWILVRG